VPVEPDLTQPCGLGQSTHAPAIQKSGVPFLVGETQRGLSKRTANHSGTGLHYHRCLRQRPIRLKDILLSLFRKGQRTATQPKPSNFSLKREGDRVQRDLSGKTSGALIGNAAYTAESRYWTKKQNWRSTVPHGYEVAAWAKPESFKLWRNQKVWTSPLSIRVNGHQCLSGQYRTYVDNVRDSIDTSANPSHRCAWSDPAKTP